MSARHRAARARKVALASSLAGFAVITGGLAAVHATNASPVATSGSTSGSNVAVVASGDDGRVLSFGRAVAANSNAGGGAVTVSRGS